MSIIGLPDPEKMFKKSHPRKNDSGELDVFEAAKYFSGANEIYAYNNGENFAQKILTDHHLQEKQASKAGRFSLDIPIRSSYSIPSQTMVMEKPMLVNKEKKHKQPSSPGGKLANFLNSLFSQTSSRKKKSKSTTTTHSIKHDQDESPGWRRKRRSSISHFRSTINPADSKSVYSITTSGFRTPPPYAYTPTKSCKDLRNYSDHQQAISFSKQPGNAVQNGVQVHAEKRQYNLDIAWLDEKLKMVDQNLQSFKNVNMGYPKKMEVHNWAERHLPEEKGYMKFDRADNGADSDSSSDLFELPIYDLDCYPSGLPVYETTNMDSIKRSAPISSAAAR